MKEFTAYNLTGQAACSRLSTMHGHNSFISRLKRGKSLKIDVVKFNLTSRCNLRCVKCLRWRRKRHLDMPYDELVNVIDQLSMHGCYVVSFSGGEPTLYKRLIDLIRYAGRKGIMSCITSNGLVIDKDYADRLAGAGLKRAHISLDSHRKKVHDHFVGMNGAYRRTVSAIKHVSRLVPDKIHDLRINTVLNRINYTELDRFIRFVGDLGVRDIKFLPYEDIGRERCDGALKLGRSELKRLERDVIPFGISIAEKFGISSNLSAILKGILETENNGRTRSVQSEMPCFQPFYRIDTNINGDVYPCCELSNNKRFLMGNVFGSSFNEVVNSDKFNWFRLGLMPPIRYKACRCCWSSIDDNLEMLSELKGIDAVNLLMGSMRTCKT